MAPIPWEQNFPKTGIPSAEDFQAAGYRTALIGKAHFQPLKSTEEFTSLEAYPVLQDLDFWKKFNGPFYGFDHVELARNHTDEAHVGQHYALWLEEKGLPDWRRYFRNPTGTRNGQIGAWDLPEKDHYNTWISERTNTLMKEFQAQNAPFFLWASFFDPHPSYLVPEPWASMYNPETLDLPAGRPGEHDRNPTHFGKTQLSDPEFSEFEEPEGNYLHGCHSHLKDRETMRKDMAIYYGMVSFMDKSIGQILDHLETKGMAEDTLVVVPSDHGHLFGQHGMTGKGPFHYEDLLKVPFIARVPSASLSGDRSPALQSLVDLAPSFYEYAGLPIPRRLQGLSQLPVWRGEKESARDHVCVENKHQPNRLHLRTVIDRRYKVTVYQDADYGELFDLQEDPDEFENRWDRPEDAALKTRLLLRFARAELAKQTAPMPRVSGA